jgi:AraC-like DNA-binding protein
MDVIWSDGEVFVAGPDSTANVMPRRPGQEFVGIRFAPGVGPAYLGVPAVDLRDRRIPVSELLAPADARRFTERVGEAADREAALSELVPPTSPEPWVRRLVARLRAGSPVAAAADELALSERQLHRRSLAAFGYGPKTLARILRLERALGMARTGMPPAEVAQLAGYADQPHLSRDVRALAGVPLKTLL